MANITFTAFNNRDEYVNGADGIARREANRQRASFVDIASIAFAAQTFDSDWATFKVTLKEAGIGSGTVASYRSRYSAIVAFFATLEDMATWCNDWHKSSGRKISMTNVYDALATLKVKVDVDGDDADDASGETGDVPTSQLDVVLAALPMLSADERAIVVAQCDVLGISTEVLIAA